MDEKISKVGEVDIESYDVGVETPKKQSCADVGNSTEPDGKEVIGKILKELHSAYKIEWKCFVLFCIMFFMFFMFTYR